MFEFGLLTRRDWVVVAVCVMLGVLVVGFGLYQVAN
jgi:hypothetical protein